MGCIPKKYRVLTYSPSVNIVKEGEMTMCSEKRDKIYKILKAISEVNCCEAECPLYYFCDENEGVCDYLKKLDNKLINE